MLMVDGDSIYVLGNDYGVQLCNKCLAFCTLYIFYGTSTSTKYFAKNTVSTAGCPLFCFN